MEKRFAHSAAHNPQRMEATEMGWTGSETNCAIRCPCDRNLQHRALTKILSTILQCGKFLKLLPFARESLRHTIRDPMRQQLGGWEGYRDVYSLGHSSYVF